MFLISKDDLEIIDRVIDELKNYSASNLTSITLKQKPWKDSYIPCKKKIISHKMIKKFYKFDCKICNI